MPQGLRSTDRLILRGELTVSRVEPYDSPGTSRFMEENNDRNFPHRPQIHWRSIHPPVLQEVEGPAASTSTLAPTAGHYRDRAVCRHRRCSGLAGDCDLWSQAPHLAEALSGFD